MNRIASIAAADRKGVVTLEYAVLAAFIAGATMVVGGAVGKLSSQLFDQVAALF